MDSLYNPSKFYYVVYKAYTKSGNSIKRTTCINTSVYRFLQKLNKDIKNGVYVSFEVVSQQEIPEIEYEMYLGQEC